MKKSVLLLSAAVLAAMTACSGGNKEANSDSAVDEKAFYEAQPLESGEYRAVSFQYGDTRADRTSFDGRMILAVTPDNSGVIIYENGNHTNFKATISMSKPFEKSDSVYTTVDAKGNTVTLIPAAEMDTLMFNKAGKEVKVAFEKQPMSVLTPQAAWTRITSKL